MIDPNIIATVASIIGVSFKEIFKAIKEYWKSKDTEQKEEIKVALIRGEQIIVQNGLATKLLVEYYKGKIEDCGSLYSFIVDNEEIYLGILAKAEWLGLEVPTNEIKCTFQTGEAPLPKIDKDILASYASSVICRQSVLGYKLWDAKTYRLINLATILRNGKHKNLEMTLGLGSFLQYRYTFGAVRDEIRQAFLDEGLLDLEGIEKRNTIIDENFQKELIDKIIKNANRRLECRNNLLPNGSILCSFNERLSIVGTNIVLAIRRPKPDDDYALIIQKRSSQVSEGPGMLQVVPAGFHQPVLDPKKEMNPKETIYRELFEELFGGEEAIYTSRRLRHDWFLETSKPMKFLIENEDSCRLECVAFGIGLPSGVCELALLFIIENSSFWKNYSREMKTNWEVVENLDPVISSKDKDTLTRLIKRREWADSGRFALAESLTRLKMISNPNYVAIEIKRGINKSKDRV